MSFYKPRGDNTVKKLYKTELHCHTGDTSLCGRATAEELLERYLEKGYSTVVVTDHFCKMTFMRSKKYLNFIAENELKATWQSKIDFFMRGYENFKKIADGKLNVLLGMEFMSWEDPGRNDYLIYGVSEDWLRASEYIPGFSYREMSIYAHEFGLKIYQAHPFREKMVITDHTFLDGIEVYNGTINVQSNNGFADAWADIKGIKKISGSDFHEAITRSPVEYLPRSLL